MISIYIVKALNRLLEPTIDDGGLEQYIEHEAILEDIPVGAWKEKNAERLNSEDFKDEARTWHMLRSLAAKAEFVKPEPPQVMEPEVSTDSSDTDPAKEKSPKRGKRTGKKTSESISTVPENAEPEEDSSAKNEENA